MEGNYHRTSHVETNLFNATAVRWIQDMVLKLNETFKVLPESYSAFKKFGPNPKFGHFRGFRSEIFCQKINFSKLPFRLTLRTIKFLMGNSEKSIFWPKIPLQKPQK